ncbi:MAG: ketosamine-3-kinase [Bacteroidetes bacterium]|nr:MAG: ketosamine-3-kinase [Bacteroidota bacterium]REK05790.1 MAG: ketosamine-3-kinase [Bacteroidota bacterium]REK31905.1 MAG: ketosamine-3-kinase [Bacteroidota bacterium]REK49970.1 MAG: ketosamine-3-kinase [Bacteroidota bacterium]
MQELHPIHLHIERKLSEEIGLQVKILHIYEVSGGCINRGQKLETTAGNFFTKTNSEARFPGMFEAERKGLELLKSTGTINLPDCLMSGVWNQQSFLLLEFIEAGKRKQDYWEKCGRQLANLHKHSQDKFGLDHNNYIGSLQQTNTYSKSWTEFFLEERLMKIGQDLISPYYDLLRKRIEEIVPHEKPALLHGDLWNGNLLTGPEGEAYFIDPSVYYGHREMDLAMTELFGGFPSEFYASYNEAFPQNPGFKIRRDLYNLYPLLVHVKLFGVGYAQQVKSILHSLE